MLRRVDPTRSPSAFACAYAALAATRLSRVVSRYVSWKLDPLLLRLTRGRVATTLVFPTAVLEAAPVVGRPEPCYGATISSGMPTVSFSGTESTAPGSGVVTVIRRVH